MEIQYAPHEQRMLNEREELEARIFNLNTFLNKGQPEDIDDCDWDLLNSQAFSMRHYNFILNARICRFKKKYKNVETNIVDSLKPKAVVSKASLVKELRSRSGLCLVECKAILEQNDWDLNKALDFLKIRL